MTFSELLKQCRFGLVESKVRYYLKHRLQWFIRLRKELLAKGVKGIFKSK
jgi:hypothetical protein